MNVGHSHPEIIKALNNKLRNLFILVLRLRLMMCIQILKRLSDLVPITEKRKAVFFNSGAEAVENSVKISKSLLGEAEYLYFHMDFR